MDKIDLKKQYKHLFAAKKGKPALVDVPRLSFLMIDGQGEPGGASQILLDRLEEDFRDGRIRSKQLG